MTHVYFWTENGTYPFTSKFVDDVDVASLFASQPRARLIEVSTDVPGQLHPNVTWFRLQDNGEIWQRVRSATNDNA